MNTVRYIALLRGINVGGRNIIKMIELRNCLEKAGFQNVTTYIQSGNVLFSHEKVDSQALEEKLGQCLKEQFTYLEPIVAYNQEDFARIVAEAPKDFGLRPDTYRYDAIFLKGPLQPRELFSQLTLKEGVDTAAIGTKALYFRRLTAKASSSHLTKITLLPAYKNLTIRNWNTTSKLASLLNDSHAE